MGAHTPSYHPWFYAHLSGAYRLSEVHRETSLLVSVRLGLSPDLCTQFGVSKWFLQLV